MDERRIGEKARESEGKKGRRQDLSESPKIVYLLGNMVSGVFHLQGTCEVRGCERQKVLDGGECTYQAQEGQVWTR
jgi:hypothetical protein